MAVGGPGFGVRDQALRQGSRAPAAAVLAVALAFVALATLGPSSVRGADQPSYADSVDRALNIVRSAPDGDRQSAREAADLLAAGTGQSQPEILDDLRADPPRLNEARERLASLSKAVHDPAFTPEPAKADRAVRDILSQPRYGALRRGPSLWDRIGSVLTTVLLWLLDKLGPVGQLPLWLRWALPVAAAGLIAGLTALIAWSARGRGRREAWTGTSRPEARLAGNRFAEADRLAAAGDLVSAVRALAGGVAAALGEDRDWEVSPLTVREIFGRAPDPLRLRPLLAVFELAVYGGRLPTPDSYAMAAAAAAPFRGFRRQEAA